MRLSGRSRKVSCGRSRLKMSCFLGSGRSRADKRLGHLGCYGLRTAQASVIVRNDLADDSVLIEPIEVLLAGVWPWGTRMPNTDDDWSLVHRQARHPLRRIIQCVSDPITKIFNGGGYGSACR